jgi:dihydroxyacetone kinase
MGGASGPIFGSIFIAMANEADKKDSIGLDDLSSMFSAALDKVKAIGGAEAGDKTLVDSLIPAVDSLKDSASKKLTLKQAIGLAGSSALEGAQSTKEMIAKKGRSRYLGERSLGYQDAGATTMYLIIKSINE